MRLCGVRLQSPLQWQKKRTWSCPVERRGWRTYDAMGASQEGNDKVGN